MGAITMKTNRGPGRKDENRITRLLAHSSDGGIVRVFPNVERLGLSLYTCH